MLPDSENRHRLDGRSITVTGGSSGIGQATCIALARRGARVVVHYHRNAQGAAETAAQISAIGGQAITIQADLRSAHDRLQLVEQAWDQCSDIHAWVHNAGADVLTGDAASESFEQKCELLWSVDVQGTTLLARLVAERMLQTPSTDGSPGAMVFIGWDQAAAGMEGDAGQMFAPVKSAVMALSASMAQSLAPRVRVNCVAPGWIQTAWGHQTDPKWDRRARESSLLERWGTPQDVANAIAFLCSDEAAFINGQTLEINGGWNRRGRVHGPSPGAASQPSNSGKLT